MSSVRRHLSSLMVAFAALVLTLACHYWLGYDFAYLERSFIGDQRDTFFNSWVLYQSFDNLLHRPSDLGYSPIFHDDPNTFAYTIAPYGIALTMLPVYLASGSNLILTYNLYYLSTFVLTAVSTHLLLRYLLRTPVVATAVCALAVAFAQYRFLHLSRIETLSMQFMILALYCFHRLLDSPSPRWALALAVTAFLTVTSSGYYGLQIVIIMLLLLGVVTYVRGRQVLRATGHWLVAVAIVGGLLCLPFIGFRLSAGLFSQQRSVRELAYLSATPQTWFVGTSLLYRAGLPSIEHNAVEEAAVFMGWTPLILAALAWHWRRVPAAVTGGCPDDRRFAPRTVVTAYALLIVVGYILSLGPIIQVDGQDILPGPFALINQIPGLGIARMPARFIVLAVLGTAVLSAYVLGLAQQRLSRLGYGIVITVVTLALLVELLPDHGYPGVVIPPRMHGNRLPAHVIEAQPVDHWLASLPPGTPVLHYPVTEPWPARYWYFGAQPFHNQPMINGWASFFPAWYTAIDWQQFPDLRTMILMSQRGIHYAIIHNHLLNTDQKAHLEQRLAEFETDWQPLPFIARFGDADVYAITAGFQPPSEID